mmetsp:Transcript_102182/g.289369  ORF Transcript_102182/g.289369 Transcript_102182/m.289369 type:complete len:307 (-) Transcript_102182:353-1273(-)
MLQKPRGPVLREEQVFRGLQEVLRRGRARRRPQGVPDPVELRGGGKETDGYIGAGARACRARADVLQRRRGLLGDQVLQRPRHDLLREARELGRLQARLHAGHQQQRAAGGPDTLELREGRGHDDDDGAAADAEARPVALLLLADAGPRLRGGPDQEPARAGREHLQLRRLRRLQQRDGRAERWAPREDRDGQPRRLPHLRDRRQVPHRAQLGGLRAGLEEGVRPRRVLEARLDGEGGPRRGFPAQDPPHPRGPVPEARGVHLLREGLPQQLQGRPARPDRGHLAGGHGGLQRWHFRLPPEPEMGI